jgi:hypothetical protein
MLVLNERAGQSLQKMKIWISLLGPTHLTRAVAVFTPLGRDQVVVRQTVTASEQQPKLGDPVDVDHRLIGVVGHPNTPGTRAMTFLWPLQLVNTEHSQLRMRFSQLWLSMNSPSQLWSVL